MQEIGFALKMIMADDFVSSPLFSRLQTFVVVIVNGLVFLLGFLLGQ